MEELMFLLEAFKILAISTVVLSFLVCGGIVLLIVIDECKHQRHQRRRARIRRQKEEEAREASSKSQALALRRLSEEYRMTYNYVRGPEYYDGLR